MVGVPMLACWCGIGTGIERCCGRFRWWQESVWAELGLVVRHEVGEGKGGVGMGGGMIQSGVRRFWVVRGFGAFGAFEVWGTRGGQMAFAVTRILAR
jgi:hypothetical protein